MKSTAEQRYQRRAAAVEAVHRGEEPNVVARVMGIPARTVFHWLALYRKGGWHNLYDDVRHGRPRKVDADVMRWLYEAITLNDPRQYQMPFCLWTLNTVRTMLKKMKGIDLSKSSLSRLLRHLGLSPQRPKYKSYRKDPAELEKYLKKTFPQLKKQARRRGAEIYFVDESAVRSDSHRGTTWSAIGQTPEVEDSGQRFTVKLISAVSPRGDMRFCTVRGSMNATKFIEFLQKLRSDAGRPIIVIADSAPYHTAGKVQKFIDSQGQEIEMEFLPKYAPELNPDEQVWNHAKGRLAKLFFTTREEMEELVLRILRSIQKSKDLVRSFFKLETTKYAAV